MRLLFGRERFTAELSWAGIGPLLPGWEIRACHPAAVGSHLDGVDAICPFGARIDAAVLAGGSFGLVQQFGVGLEKVDVEAATRLGVWVSRIPGDAGGNADSVAELAVLHLLALIRRLDDARATLAAGTWEQRPTGGSLAGATVLIVGLGAIGTALVQRLAPFGVSLLGVRARPELGGPEPVRRTGGPGDLPELLGQADAVVCCAMFDPSSAGMFGAEAFAAMRPGALFINVARGGLVDEPALLAALESGQVGGAGLDVHATEPADPDSALLRHPRVLATPHVGGLTEVMFRRSSAVFAQNMLRWAAGQEPRWAVNAPAFCRARD
ncbi:MAG TPA: NAD(P)-dependent oxidoreductase [Streptosporangiaceae bacterium]